MGGTKKRMKKLFKSKFLCLFFTCVLLISSFPEYVVKAADGVYTKVTSLADIIDGDYILYGVNDTNVGAMGDTVTSGRFNAVAVNESNGVITNPDETAVWAITATVDGFTLQNKSTGKYVNIKDTTTKGFEAVDTPVNFTITTGSKGVNDFYVTAANGRSISIFKTDFRPYGESNLFPLYLYKLSTEPQPPVEQTKVSPVLASLPDGSSFMSGDTVSLSCNTEGAKITYQLSIDDQPTVEVLDYTGAITLPDANCTLTAIGSKDGLEDSISIFTYTILTRTAIADARALSSGNVYVSGTVTFVDGNNIYIQDDTAAINVYKSDGWQTTPSIGQNLTVSGTIGEYKNLKQIAVSNYTIDAKVHDLPEAKTVTIEELSDPVQAEALEAQRVRIEDVTLGAIDTSSNTQITQNEKTFNIYRCPTLDASVYEGCVVSMNAIVSQYNTAYQLRIASAQDVVLKGEPSTVAKITADASTEVTTGTTVTFTTQTSDALISISLDQQEWKNENTYTVTGNIGDTVTVYVKAEKEGCQSAQQTFMFTITDKKYDPIPDDSDVFASAMNIKQVLQLADGTTGVTVVGQLVFLATSYGNPVIQDVIDGETYSLYVYGAAPDEAKVGDIITFNSGTYSIYHGLPELASTATQTIVGTAKPMGAEEYTMADIKRDGLGILGRYVKVKDVTLGAYNAAGTTALTDSTGSLNMYKGVAYPSGIAEGDIVDLYAMVSCNYNTIQMNTGLSSYVLTNDTKAPVITIADKLLDAKTGQDYTIAAEIADASGIKEATVSVTIGTEILVYPMQLKDGKYTYTVPKTVITKDLGSFTFTITAVDNSVNNNTVTSEVKTVQVDNKPQITVVAPAINGSTGEDTTPEFKVSISNGLNSPKVELTVDDHTVEMEYSNGYYGYSGLELTKGSHKATVKVTREDSVTNEFTWNFTVGELTVKRYFGQLHSHTQYSDGSGTLDIALEYFKAIAKQDNVDFVSFTDHSNYFDTKTSANPPEALNDISKMTAESRAVWEKYRSTIDTYNETFSDKLALSGFEMTWSGGPGHINTFNSEGLVSRNNTSLNSKTSDAGLQAYYDILTQNTDKLANLSQFNHPGTTFGNFSDFGYYTQTRDAKMVMVEVGNGEGGIGSGGYFPSYEQYTLALDKGWHVAPSNNQDNHKGKWGNANTARSVILADNLSKDGLLTAMADRRMYATEDKNLELDFTINQVMMGSIISEIPTSNLQVQINAYDPDPSDTIAKIELVTNSGKVVQTKSCSESTVNWSFELPVEQGYYYVRVTEADLNIAVTAPIWIGSAPLVGINSVEVSTKMPVTGEELTVTTSLFNNEETAKQLESITYTVGNNTPITKELNTSIPSMGTVTNEFSYTPTATGTLTISIEIMISGNKYTSKKELTVVDANKLIYVGIDASNYNEYVNGNYKDSMGNFTALATNYSVRVVELKTEDALIAATKNPKYEMLILTPPTRRNGSELLADYQNWSEQEITAITDFAKRGKTVILTGWGDYYESYKEFPQEDHMSAQQNKLLKALGAHLRLSDDELKDETNNGGQSQRLYLTEYNWSNPLLANVEQKQIYSCYGGSTIYITDETGNPTQTIPAAVNPLVYGFATSGSYDDDKDNYAGVTIPKYNGKYMTAATEQVTYENGNTANIIVAGSVFMSNFEIQVEIDNAGTLPYSNYKIAQNILNTLNPISFTKIMDVQAAAEGQTFTVQGTATSNSSGYDKSTAFFDCIYIQDETAGINLFPVSDTVKAGQTVIVTGVTSSYNGERQLKVEKIEVLDMPSVIPEARKVTAREVNEFKYLGQIVKVEGTVTKIHTVNELVESIYVIDSLNEETRIFIDGYITPEKEISGLAVGCFVSAVGLSSKDTSYEGSIARIRIRDRADIVCTKTEPIVIPEPSTPLINVRVNGQISIVTVPSGMEQDNEKIKECLISALLTPDVTEVVLKIQENQDSSIPVILPKEVLKMAAVHNKDIQYVATNGSGRELYSITLTASNLRKAEQLDDLDLRLQISDKVETVMNYSGVSVSFASQGELATQVKVNIPVSALENVKEGTKVYLYAVNRELNKLEPVPFGTTYKVSQNKDITFNVTIGREYILTTQKAKKGTIITTRELIQLPDHITVDAGTTNKIDLVLPPTLELTRSFYQPAKLSAHGKVKVNYTSSNRAIAIVGKDGIIRTKKSGTIVVTTTITTYFGAVYQYRTTVTIK